MKPWERYPTNKHGWNTERDLPVAICIGLGVLAFAAFLFWTMMKATGCNL